MDALKEILQCLVVVVVDLKINLSMADNSMSTPVQLGTCSVPFSLQKSKAQHILYLDSSAMMTQTFRTDFSRSICLQVARELGQPWSTFLYLQSFYLSASSQRAWSTFVTFFIPSGNFIHICPCKRQ